MEVFLKRVSIEKHLTLRETEVLEVLAGNWKFSNKEIADKLNVSENAIKRHFKKIYRKFGYRNKRSYAMRRTLVHWLWMQTETPEAQ